MFMATSWLISGPLKRRTRGSAAAEAAVLTLPNSGYQRLMIRGVLQWTLQPPERLECRRQSRFSSRHLATNQTRAMSSHVDDSDRRNPVSLLWQDPRSDVAKFWKWLTQTRLSCVIALSPRTRSTHDCFSRAVQAQGSQQAAVALGHL